MDIVDFILSQTLFDVVFIVALLVAVILGFVQGAIRRLLGTVAMLVAFLIAANLRDPLGTFLADNWTQFAPAYAVMIGFLFLFLVLWVALSVLIQGFYKRSLINRSEALDEIVGAALGAVEVVLLVGILGLILDSYFQTGTARPERNEIELLRTIFRAWDLSQISATFRDVLSPALLGLVGWLLPDTIAGLYRR